MTKGEDNRNEEEGRQRDWREKGGRQMGKEGVERTMYVELMWWKERKVKGLNGGV